MVAGAASVVMGAGLGWPGGRFLGENIYRSVSKKGERVMAYGQKFEFDQNRRGRIGTTLCHVCCPRRTTVVFIVWILINSISEPK